MRRALVDAGFRVERLPGPRQARDAQAIRPAWKDMVLKRFNVRVYFFLLDRLLDGGRPDPASQILLSDEFLAGQDCTKLPGGGSNSGKGRWTAPAGGARGTGASHRLATPPCDRNFVQSAWRGRSRCSATYLATLPDPVNFRDGGGAVDYPGEDLESFRWAPLKLSDRPT